MPLKSIQQRIAVIGGLCLLISAGILIGYSVYLASSTQHLVSTRVSQQAQEDALQNLQHLAGQYAEEIRTEFTERRWKRRAAWQPPSRSPSRRRTADCRSAATRSTRSC